MKSSWIAALALIAAAALAPRAGAQAPAGCSSCVGSGAVQGYAGAGYASVGCAAGIGHATGGCDSCAVGGCGTCTAGACGDCGWGGGLIGRLCQRKCGKLGCDGCDGCKCGFCRPLGDTCCPGKDGLLVRLYCCMTRKCPNPAPMLKRAEYPLGFPQSPYIRSPRDYFMVDTYQPGY